MNSIPLALIAVVATLLVLCYCYYELEKVTPTTENLAKDISKPLPWPLRVVGFLLDLLPFTLWDISDADSLLKQGAMDAGLSVELYSPLVVESIHKLRGVWLPNRKHS